MHVIIFLRADYQQAAVSLLLERAVGDHGVGSVAKSSAASILIRPRANGILQHGMDMIPNVAERNLDSKWKIIAPADTIHIAGHDGRMSHSCTPT